jgi:hypothetical protein
VVEVRGWKGRIGLFKDLSERTVAAGSITSVGAPKPGVQTMTRTFVFKRNWWLILRSHVKRLAGPPCLVAVSLPGFERCTCFDYDNDMRCTGELVVANGDYCTSFTICVVLLLITLSRHTNHNGYSTTVRCRDDILITTAA